MAKRRKKSPQKTPKLKPHNYIKKVARKLPIHECLVLESWREEGITPVIISRKKSNGNIVLGSYIVDIWCLGIKDTYYLHDMFPSDYEKYKNQVSGNGEMELEKITPNFAFNLIYGAVEYAEDIGFSPHKDFKITEYILDDVETVEYEEIEFGKDGKPFYVSGPYDNTNYIMGVLGKNVGQDNFDFISEVQNPYNSELEAEEIIETLINKHLPPGKRNKVFDNLKTDEEKALYTVQTFIAEGLTVNFKGSFEDLPEELEERIYDHIITNAKDAFNEGKEFVGEGLSTWDRNIELTYRKLRKHKSFDFILDKNYTPTIKIKSSEELEKMSESEQLEYEEYLKENSTDEENFKMLLMPVILPIIDKVTSLEKRRLTDDEMNQVVEESIIELRNLLKSETIDTQRENFEELIFDILTTLNYNYS